MKRVVNRRFVRRPDRVIAAVRLAFDMEGFRYRKWGGEQFARPGDWVVDNDGDVYTIDAEVFSRSYRQVATGAFVKTTPVWAFRAEVAGVVQTAEGATSYERGDYLVSHHEDGSDAYAVSAEKFEALFEPWDCDQ